MATPQERMFNDVTPVKRQDGIGGSRLFSCLQKSSFFKDMGIIGKILQPISAFYIVLTST
jgi:hypothetical protein